MESQIGISVLTFIPEGYSYTHKLIENILGQDFLDIELFIISEESDDTTKKIIESYSDRRIIHMTNKEEKGNQKYQSFNTVFQAITGKYVLFLDIRNNLKSYCLRELWHFLEEHPNALAVCSDYICRSSNTYYSLPHSHKELKLALFKLTHEIKNPIAVCKGYLEMLDIKNKDKLKKYLLIIKDEINRTLSIINDFSDYGKLQIEKEEVDVLMLLEDIEETLKPLLQEKQVTSKFIMKEEELYAYLDYNRMKQVIINMIKNAIEAKDESRTLSIITTVKKIKDEIQIRIEDTGTGISKENLEKIDKIFYTTKENGTGLGVALSKEIVEQHHGTLLYQSKVGKGTKVTILLPIKEN